MISPFFAGSCRWESEKIAEIVHHSYMNFILVFYQFAYAPSACLSMVKVAVDSTNAIAELQFSQKAADDFSVFIYQDKAKCQFISSRLRSIRRASSTAVHNEAKIMYLWAC